MDSGELEKELEITINSKVTWINYSSDNGMSDDKSHVINVLDTPGHDNFAGKVYLILSTVNNVVLVVDAGVCPKY